MRSSKRFFLMAVLVIVNMFLAAGHLSADGDNKQCVFEEGSIEDHCQEFCWTTCYFCDCGGECEDNCGEN